MTTELTGLYFSNNLSGLGWCIEKGWGDGQAIFTRARARKKYGFGNSPDNTELRYARYTNRYKSC
jgi:hypothetical protein